MTVNCTRPSKAEEKEYYHNIAITAVFGSVYGCLYFLAKTTQAEAKDTGMLTYGGKPYRECLMP